MLGSYSSPPNPEGKDSVNRMGVEHWTGHFQAITISVSAWESRQLTPWMLLTSKEILRGERESNNFRNIDY